LYKTRIVPQKYSKQKKAPRQGLNYLDALLRSLIEI